MRVNQGPKRPLKREREKIWGKNQFCRAGAGAGGAEIVLLTWSRNRSRTKLFRLRCFGAEMIYLPNILVILLYCRQFGGCQDE